MNKTNIIQLLYSGGYFGKRSLDASQLLVGFKDYSHEEIDRAIWSLFEERIVFLYEENGSPRISLNPREIDRIRKIAEAK